MENFKENFKIFIKLIFKNYPRGFKYTFLKTINLDNWQRARIFSILLLIPSVAMYFVTLNSNPSELALTLHKVLVLDNIIFIGLFFIKKRQDEKFGFYEKLVTYSFAFFVLYWGAIRVSIDPRQILTHLTFMGLIVVLAAVYYFKWYYYLLLNFFGIIFLVYLYSLFNMDSWIVQHLITYANIVMIGFAVSRMFYISKIDSFIKNKKLENYSQHLEEIIERRTKQLKKSYSQLKNANDKLQTSYNELNEVTEKLEMLINLTGLLSISEEDGEKNFLKNLLDTAIKIVSEASTGTVFKYNDDRIEFIDSYGHNTNNLKKLDLQKNVFCNNKTPQIINNFDRFVANKIEDAKNKKLFENSFEPIKETICFNLTIDNKELAGISIDIPKSESKSFDQASLRIMSAFKNIASAFYKMQKYNILKGKFHKQLIVSITELLSIHNRYTRGHSQNVAELAHDLAKRMGLPGEELTKAYWAGMVHDIGKMLVTNDILDKEAKLNSDEYEIIKKHPVWGYKALKRTEELEELAIYVRHHHERWDGNGYPDQLEKEEIPLISQIISVVDAWDAMTSDRAYREPLSDKKAIKQLKQKKGTQFSPRIVDIFINMISQTVKS